MEKKVFHESSAFHVTGEAIYIDDMQLADEALFGVIYYSPYAHAKIKSYDLSKAENLKGVKAILSYKDLPSENQMGPIIHDELILAEDEVHFVGQAIFIIAAESEEIAYQARKLIEVEYEELPAVISIQEAIKQDCKLQPTRTMQCGDVEKALKESPNTFIHEIETGAQEHWYLETQIALCCPGEGDEMKVYSSTQNPTETQAIVAEVLGVHKMDVEVEIRRLGGAFGGKETQANHVSAWAAVAAKKTRKPVKVRLFRDEDQKITGKRHPYLFKYKVGFDNEGNILAVDSEINSNAGHATDLTMAVLERTMMHSENSYYIPNMRLRATAWRTNLPSNTAYRGFGGPQGVAGIESIIDTIARKLKKDPAEIRLKNFYGIDDRNITPYGQIVENNRLYVIWEQINKSSEYQKRRKEVDEFNGKNEFIKRGLSLTPIKFGISFTATFLNQAGALVNIYTDGTVLVNHGGTEMGQGLNTKMQQIAALELGVNLNQVKVNATNTSKVPNTSPTAASSGTDLNGMAVKIAVAKIKKRIAKVIANEFNKGETDYPTKAKDIVFADNYIFDAKNNVRKIAFKDAMPIVRFNQESLSATGFYKTPNINYDRATESGRPFHYFSFGMAVSEVEIDTLTGEYTFLRADLLHDVGETLNREIDLGQIEGGFIQGVGWCTTEECKWNKEGHLLNHSPDTYKIPGIKDIPNEFNVDLLEGYPNTNTIRRSKAVGEPPFMLATSTWLAIQDAISAVGNHKILPDYHLPATNEKILLSVEKIRKQIK